MDRTCCVQFAWFCIRDRRKFATLVGALWEGYHESRRCSRDSYPESYITKYTSLGAARVHVPNAAGPHLLLAQDSRAGGGGAAS